MESPLASGMAQLYGQAEELKCSMQETAELLLNNSKTAKAITSSEANGALSVLCHSLEGSQAIWQSISNRLPKFDHDSPSAPSSEEVR